MKIFASLVSLVLISVLSTFEIFSQDLRINELIARNSNGIVDEFGDDDDWIEIYNPGASAVNLAGLYISDTNSNADFFRIPSFDPAKTTVSAGGYLLLWADGEPAEGANHLPFKLSNGGEGVYLGKLSGGSISIIDEVVYPKLERDVSYGRYPNSTGSFKILSDPSPNSVNLPIRVVSGMVINEIMAVNNGSDTDEDGESEDWIEFYNPTGQSIDLGGLYLTDSIGELTMHRIPIHQPDSTTISAGGFLRFWCDAEPRTSVWHIDFKLGRGGEKVTLTQPDGKTIIQEISYPSASSDASFGQYPDGSNNWIYLNVPTANSANQYTFSSISGIVINEFMADNESVYPDNLGEIEDWIELYNSNDYAVDVGGLIFTDSLQDPIRYRIPHTESDSTTIPPKGYLVFWADNQPEQGILHLDIKLSGSGESIGLYQYRSSLVKIDSHTFGSQSPNITTGRSPDGSSTWLTLSEPTPGSSNSGGSSLIISGLYLNEFMARNTKGYTDEFGNIVDWIELYNSTSIPIDIGGLYFSDNIDNPKLSQIPDNQPSETTVPAKGYLIVWPDGKPELGARHVNFQLAGAGENISIYQEYDGVLHTLQTRTYPAQTSDVSFGRAPDGGVSWSFFAIPSPMAPNHATGVFDIEFDKIPIEVYPNPVSRGQDLVISGIQESDISWSLMSLEGKTVSTGEQRLAINGMPLVIDADELLDITRKGIYLLQIASGSKIYIKKLIWN